MVRVNEFGQPVGDHVDWGGARRPQPVVLNGTEVRLEPVEERHAPGILAFDDLGHRRYEWKCDSLNAPSRRAALRLGFTEEGTWRQALVTKGRNRDTAWFSITDAEWPAVDAAIRAWLDDSNHDEHGRQRRSLADLRAVP